MAKEIIDKILEKLSISSGRSWTVFPGVILDEEVSEGYTD
jgi:hypothetical protein